MNLIERFTSLAGIEGLFHGFVKRIPMVDVGVEKEEALEALRAAHDRALEEIGTDRSRLWTAEQIHGRGIGLCGAGTEVRCLPGVDGLVTAGEGQALGIYVADCCAVFLVDPENRACGLIHSGKKGTELEIVPKAIALMGSEYGTRPAAVVAQLSPCIRPPRYELDFAATIREQCRSAGVVPENIHDAGTCTGENVGHYYSYRQEMGKTGRMLAVLGFESRRQFGADPADAGETAGAF
jgi:copper oxidase (laccase) domain-containing protein